VKQYQFFHFDDVDLVFSDDAPTRSPTSVEAATGARGLRAILEESLLEVMYDLPSRPHRQVHRRPQVVWKRAPTLVTKRGGARLDRFARAPLRWAG
jgi:ATP-dependent protease Clp ATPase subunit